ncbi:MAG: sugar kinase [Omnitrophica bacterium RBG_13_46_9]|nr:MAG: sugar kinase [Omnitrophica bacterium RBG_13_46_9]
MSVLVVGSVALDTIRTPMGRRRDVLGGSAVYFSVSASNFCRVNLVAVVGDDFPSRHVDFLRRKGVDVKGLVTASGKTFRWEGEYDWNFSDPRTISTKLNVFSGFDPDIPREYRNSKYLFLANIDPHIQERVLRQMTKPKLVACDTMNYWIENKRPELVRLLKKVDILLLNESEIRGLTGQTNLIKAAKAVLRFGPGKVIVKKGEHGSLLFSGDHIFSAPAYLMESIIDPTGAGDTFAGGVIGYLATCRRQTHADLRKAIVYGSVMATFAVEDFSLRRLGSVGRDDILRRYRELKRLTYF